MMEVGRWMLEVYIWLITKVLLKKMVSLTLILKLQNEIFVRMLFILFNDKR